MERRRDVTRHPARDTLWVLWGIWDIRYCNVAKNLFEMIPLEVSKKIPKESICHCALTVGSSELWDEVFGHLRRWRLARAVLIGRIPSSLALWKLWASKGRPGRDARMELRQLRLERHWNMRESWQGQDHGKFYQSWKGLTERILIPRNWVYSFLMEIVSWSCSTEHLNLHLHLKLLHLKHLLFLRISIGSFESSWSGPQLGPWWNHSSQSNIPGPKPTVKKSSPQAKRKHVFLRNRTSKHNKSSGVSLFFAFDFLDMLWNVMNQ